MSAPIVFVLLLLVLANALVSLALYRRQRLMGHIARLHVVLQLELAAGEWDHADADLAALELIPGGVDPEFHAMALAAIAYGRGEDGELGAAVVQS